MPNIFVNACIDAIKGVDPEYWNRTLTQRAERSGVAQGSIYPGVGPEQLEARLRIANWEPYEDPAILAGCKAFRAELPGRLGLVELKTLPPETPVRLDDVKSVGTVSAVVTGVDRPAVDFTVLIVGRDNESAPWVVWTFHPGAPVRPSTVKSEGRHGEIITAKEAIELGFDLAKIA